MKAVAKIAGLAALAGLTLASGPFDSAARAQGQTIRCESINGNYRECDYYGEGGSVRLYRQLSESRCDEGRSWGFDGRRRVLWVAQGCRGEFLVDFDRGRDGRFGDRDDFRPQVRQLRNGDTEVAFDNGCIVTFDNRGRRTFARQNCGNDDLRRAEFAMRRENRDDDRQPEVNMGRNGEGEVFFRANNCVVNYNFRGQRTSNRQNCSRDQLRVADQAMADYRRSQRF